ncbi:GFA family protein [Parerythrobacter jejuensis]
MKAKCHCGKVSVTLARAPGHVNLCDCSLCRKTGGAWGYFSGAEVAVEGETQGYRRADYPKPAVEIQRCSLCGTVTHWTLTEHHPGDRVGVNMRIFSPPELDGIEARTIDGHNWFGETTPAERRSPGRLGEDVFI